MKRSCALLIFSALTLAAQDQPPAAPAPVPAPSTAAAAGSGPAPAAAPALPPVVYILCGSPGDETRHTTFEKRLTALRQWFTKTAGLPAAAVQVYYGPESAGYRGTAGRNNVQKVCTEIVEKTKTGQPVWLILMGHANDAPGDVRFNLPGDDLSGKELAAWLTGAATGEHAGSLSIILTTACSGRAIKHLAGPGRAIIAAANATEGADETVFPDGLVQALADRSADTNGDGLLSLTEIFLAARAAVITTYQSQGYLLTEHACLDGDGDGKATQRPSETDAQAAGASAHSLKLSAPSGSS